MKILAVIAARGGSKGVKNKNIRILGDKPLIAHTIEQIKKWGKFDKFIVSTDSEEIARVAQKFGAEVPFLRPLELASDTSAKMDALRHSLLTAEKHYGTKFDALLDLDATSPVRTVKDITGIVEMFKSEKADCVFSVVKSRKNPYFNMVEKLSDGSVKICKKTYSEIIRRQDSPEVFDMNASMYVYARDYLIDVNNKNPYSKVARIYEMGEKSAIDIDTELDFKFMEFLMKEEEIKL
ncbi:MAG: acylneuraminate cytidylyltransferase family protein [Candidatus Omnitrophota bacterium]